VKGNTIHLYGGTTVSRTLEETLAGQMDHPNFPVHLSDMGATMYFHDLTEGQVLELDAGDGTKAKISSGAGNHPNGVMAYRIEHGGHSMVYATDTEHYDHVDAKLLKLSQGADVLIYDAQYTPEEYTGTAGTGGPKVGWGHSTFEEAIKLANAANVKELVLFHHDPMQSDAAVRSKENRAKALHGNVRAAYEGLTIQL
jgi:phosphoribosyl 1,2-cyclic phosphodiesterase